VILANDKNPVVKLLSQEILSAKAEVEGKTVERFAADLASLKAAAQAKDFDGANSIYDRILTYGTDAMKAEAKAAWEPLIAGLRAIDAAKEQSSSAQKKQLEVGRAPREGRDR